MKSNIPKIKDENLHHIGSEFLDKCRRCNGNIEMIQEGTFWNPQSDITQCSCITIEHPNSIQIMGQELSFGNSRVIK